MASCGNCRKRIGLFESYRKLAGMTCCLPCVPKVMERRRRETLERLMQAEAVPDVLFAVPAISKDIDYPSNSRRYAGVLLFADKGIIFAEYGEYKKGRFGLSWALFGWLGALIAGLAERKTRQGAATQAQEAVDMAAGNHLAILDSARQIFFFPIEQIARLKHDSTNCFPKLRKEKVQFQWVGGRKTIAPHKETLRTYARAVTNGDDVVAACRHLQGSGVLSPDARRPAVRDRDRRARPRCREGFWAGGTSASPARRAGG